MPNVDVLQLLLSIIGALVVWIMQGIKSEIKEIKTTISSIEKDIRGGLSELDRRVTHIEARCDEKHK